jgi:chemotaxis protein CheD
MNNLNVGLGEIKIAKKLNCSIVAPGLGSCIGLLMYDVVNEIAGMVHVVLPETKDLNIPNPGKYANTGAEALLDQLVKQGANKANLKVYIAGGAQMFSFSKGSNILNIGVRNTIAVKEEITRLNLRLLNSHTGGSKGRTFKIDLPEGKISVRCIGEEEIILGGK